MAETTEKPSPEMIGAVYDEQPDAYNEAARVMADNSNTTVSLDRRELTWLVTLCDARAHNLQKTVDGDPDEDTPDARADIGDLKTLARKLRDARGF